MVCTCLVEVAHVLLMPSMGPWCFTTAFYYMIHPMIRVRSTPPLGPLSLAWTYMIGISVAAVLVNSLDYGMKCLPST